MNNPTGEALKIWRALQPMIAAEIKKATRSPFALTDEERGSGGI